MKKPTPKKPAPKVGPAGRPNLGPKTLEHGDAPAMVKATANQKITNRPTPIALVAAGQVREPGLYLTMGFTGNLQCCTLAPNGQWRTWDDANPMSHPPRFVVQFLLAPPERLINIETKPMAPKEVKV